MASILIKRARIIDEDSSFHLSVKDIRINNGIVDKIKDEISDPCDTVIKGNQLHVCIGLCDIGTHMGEPGAEHRETMDSLTKAARAGGFTALAVFPDVNPVIDNKIAVRYLLEHQDTNGVTLFPIAALSKGLKGKDISEFYDLKSGGAVGFSDALHTVVDPLLLSRALLYSRDLNMPILQHPDNISLSEGGQMHEGIASTCLGLKGTPIISEVQTIQRDITTLEYHNASLIFHALSCGKSVELIKEARQRQVNVSSTVSYLNLIKTDEDLMEFDVNLKVKPVLRSREDRNMLIKGLKDGVIHAIISNHQPLDEESKKVEFPYALSGAAGLETMFSAVVDALSMELGLTILIRLMTKGARTLLNLPIPKIEIGAYANLCVFDTQNPWYFNMNNTHSRSINYPFNGHVFNTKVVATFL